MSGHTYCANLSEDMTNCLLWCSPGPQKLKIWFPHANCTFVFFSPKIDTFKHNTFRSQDNGVNLDFIVKALYLEERDYPCRSRNYLLFKDANSDEGTRYSASDSEDTSFRNAFHQFQANHFTLTFHKGCELHKDLFWVQMKGNNFTDWIQSCFQLICPRLNWYCFR